MSPWQVSLAYRYLNADRYFSGSDELPMEPGSQVINTIHSFDILATYSPTPRINLSVDLPIIYAERTTRHEHMGMGGPQFTTRAAGIGDLRVTADYWLRDPAQHPKANLSFGLGVKPPTGSDDEEDDFHQPGGPVRRPVDVAIQPGDGGWGIIFQTAGYWQLTDRLFTYLNGMYLMSPKEFNNTASFSAPGSPNNDDVNSVPDQYLGRGGFSYALWPEQGLSLSLGGRLEGIPPHDAVGGDGGFRRPGFIVSIEPGLSWMKGKNTLSLTAPVALLRNRQRSATDEITGGHGDASFADFLLFFTYTRQF